MFLPLLYTWIEEPGTFSGLRVKRGKIWSFVMVTVETRVREVVQLCLDAMLPCNNVIDLVLNKFSLLRDVAVLAPALRTVDDLET